MAVLCLLVGQQSATAATAASAEPAASTARSATEGIASITSPRAGHPTRAAVLSAVRPEVQALLKQPHEGLRFVVRSLRVSGVWAYLWAVPVSAQGQPIAGSANAEDDFGNEVRALLRLNRGKWSVVDLSLGANDAPQADWPLRFGVPAGMLR